VNKVPTYGYTAEFNEQPVKHAQAVGIVAGAGELDQAEQAARLGEGSRSR